MNENQTQIEKDFLEAYEKYSDKIFRHCYFRNGDRERALELMQETFTKTWNYIKEGNKLKIEFLQAFLYKVANNLLIDDSKKKRTESLESMEEATGFTPGVDNSQEIKTKIDLDLIKEVFPKMNPDYREVIVMRYIDDLAPKEMAKILNVSENLVSVRINRAIDQLKKLLKQHE